MNSPETTSSQKTSYIPGIIGAAFLMVSLILWSLIYTSGHPKQGTTNQPPVQLTVNKDEYQCPMPDAAFENLVEIQNQLTKELGEGETKTFNIIPGQGLTSGAFEVTAKKMDGKLFVYVQNRKPSQS